MAVEQTLYHRAVIHTLAPGAPPAEALLVEGERIAAIGSLQDVENVAARDARRIDLEGQAIIPGFNDCHCHVLGIGLGLLQLDVGADAVSSIAEIQTALRVRAAATPAESWILGRGYDQNMMAERRHPTRQELDTATTSHPVVLRHTSGHVLTANSRALQAAGIDESMTDPPGGVIDRDEHGRPTGLLKESAMRLVDRAIPPPSLEEGAGAIARATRHMARFGITSATDAATGDGESAEPQLAMYRRALAAGGLDVRLLLCPQIHFVAPPDEDGSRAPDEFDAGDEPLWLAIEGTKIFSDGAMSTRTAALRTPYADDPNNLGVLLWEQATLADMMRRAHAAGWRIVTHALGDRAVESVLDAYAQVGSAEELRARRHRMEHCMVLDDALAARIKELGIVPVMQPDIFRLGDGYVAAMGLDRAAEVIPMGTLRRAGVLPAFSSDAPVVPCDPLRVIQSAIERKTPSGDVLGSHHAVTGMDGVAFYTLGGAHATHHQRDKGALRAGVLADFVVLSGDPARSAIEEWPELRVTLTIVDGRPSYQATSGA